MRYGKLRFVSMEQARERDRRKADHVVYVICEMARSLISGIHRQVNNRGGEADHLIDQGLSCCCGACLERLIVGQKLSKVKPHLQEL